MFEYTDQNFHGLASMSLWAAASEKFDIATEMLFKITLNLDRLK